MRMSPNLDKSSRNSTLDETDLRILEILQTDGRITAKALAQRVNMSAPAAIERMRRLDENGVIAGYMALVNPLALELNLRAYIRLRHNGGNYKPLRALLEGRHEIIECDHVTGDDCFIMKVVTSSMHHLEDLTSQLAALGAVTTSLVYSNFIANRPLRRAERKESARAASPGPRRSKTNRTPVRKS